MRDLSEELAELSARGLLRVPRHLGTAQGPRVEIDGRPVRNFSSNDYLGLASHPRIRQAAAQAVTDFGAGSGASRLICGGLPPHRQLEETARRFLDAEAALSFANGYAAAVGTLGAVAGKGDIVILDKLCHACLIDGARLSGATLRVFPHNRVDKLEALLANALKKIDPQTGRIIVVTESIFSMDGDRARLAEIAALTRQAGALLLLDEAHAFGILGQNGRGLAEAEQVIAQVDLRMATMGKAAGAAGGIVVGSEEAIALLWNKARSFIFSTAPPPAQAAAATAGLEILASTEGAALRERLGSRIQQFHDCLQTAFPGRVDLRRGAGQSGNLSPIIPLLIGDERQAVETSGKLLESGILCPAVRYPTVPRKTARLRITLSAAHELEDIEILVANLRRTLPEDMPDQTEVPAQ
jgi:8-amino-7-oxononanoate synthase